MEEIPYKILIVLLWLPLLLHYEILKSKIVLQLTTKYVWSSAAPRMICCICSGNVNCATSHKMLQHHDLRVLVTSCFVIFQQRVGTHRHDRVAQINSYTAIF